MENAEEPQQSTDDQPELPPDEQVVDEDDEDAAPDEPLTEYEPYQKGVEAGSRTVGRWSAGDDVQHLQDALNAFNPRLSRLALDGYFGPRTTDRVRYVQTKAKISVDGIVGSQTWNVLL
jgi:peptidoglycan hydrolase-like protein with peptidoglycan-binding domain